MEKFWTMFFAVVVTFALSVSLAGCGNDNITAEPPVDNGNVAGESAVSLDGTYQSDNAPATLGEEITFSGNTITTAAGDGTYKVEGGKLTIQYDNGNTAYAFHQSGDSIFLDDVEFVKVDEAAVKTAYDSYTPSADDPYPGLIIGIVRSSNPKVPPELVVSVKELEGYVRQIVHDPEMLSGRFYVEESNVSTRPVINDGAALWYLSSDLSFGEWTEQYGAVLLYNGASNYSIYFTVDETKILTGADVYYSLSLNRPLTPEEYRWRTEISHDEASVLWPDDYAKYAQ
ncbi:MAG: hypothetical protein LBN34_05590 [Clostridiales Family XIII bacterium]|jgi:hypothetical protein|nr:hypothetical protein [Clostridiales Family XIII bacterium]